MPGTHPSATLDGMWLSGLPGHARLTVGAPVGVEAERRGSWQGLTCTVFRRVSWSEHIERSHRFSAAWQIQ